MKVINTLINVCPQPQDPDFSSLLTYLIDAAGLHMRKGSLATIDLQTPLGDGEGELRWLVPPDLLTTK